MKMNWFEKMSMNSPIRAMFLRWYEAPLLRRLGGRLDGLNVLEVGCGRGVGTQLLFEQFGAGHIKALDLDPDMIARARRRLAVYMPDRLTLEVGDITAIQAEDHSFDAVVDFAVLHHIPNWQAAVSEIRRVLKPGGRFLFEEVTKHALDKWFYRTFMVHPEENRFTALQFVQELERQGFVINGNFVERNRGDFVFGAGRSVDAAGENAGQLVAVDSATRSAPTCP